MKCFSVAVNQNKGVRNTKSMQPSLKCIVPHAFGIRTNCSESCRIRNQSSVMSCARSLLARSTNTSVLEVTYHYRSRPCISLHGRRSPKSGKPGKYRLLGLAVQSNSPSTSRRELMIGCESEPLSLKGECRLLTNMSRHNMNASRKSN